jgi:hypothetical protein
MKKIYNLHFVKMSLLFCAEFGTAFLCASTGCLKLYLLASLGIAIYMKIKGLQ